MYILGIDAISCLGSSQKKEKLLSLPVRLQRANHLGPRYRWGLLDNSG